MNRVLDRPEGNAPAAGQHQDEGESGWYLLDVMVTTTTDLLALTR